jgi:hypothetical protein
MCSSYRNEQLRTRFNELVVWESAAERKALVNIMYAIVIIFVFFMSYINLIYAVKFSKEQNVAWITSVLVGIFTGAWCAARCCAVLCCAVLCCAVLCCAVLCCAVLCCAVLCCAHSVAHDCVVTLAWCRGGAIQPHHPVHEDRRGVLVPRAES